MSLVYFLVFAVIALAFGFIRYNFVSLRKLAEGTPLMVQNAERVRSGAKVFLRREDRVIVWAVSVLAVIFTLTQEISAGVCLLSGSILVRCATEVGLRGGTLANIRTTNEAKQTNSIGRTLRVALIGGSISGFSVPAFGMLGFTIIFLVSYKSGPNTVGRSLLLGTPCNVMSARLAAYSLGCSVIAMFNRVAGGTFTKMEDIGGDGTSKGKHKLPEDSPFNVCLFGDLVGDCVNDLLANIADLLESYIATPMACIVIALQNYGADPKTLAVACAFPFALIAAGAFSTIVGIMIVIFRHRERHMWMTIKQKEALGKSKWYIIPTTNPETRQINDHTEFFVRYCINVKDPGKEINATTAISATLTLGIGLLGACCLFRGTPIAETFKVGWVSPWLAATLGVVSSVSVGLLTERYTSAGYKHVKGIYEKASQDASLLVSEGIAVGNHSVFYPTIVIAAAIAIAYLLCGVYGVSVAAVGMLSFVGTTVAIDAFGPICDNAGGFAEAAFMKRGVREITDRLDALGNVTAAVGKGNAIGAAAFSTITMIIAFIGNIPHLDLNSTDSIVRIVVGGLAGMAVVKEFISILAKNTIIGADKMCQIAEEEFDRLGISNASIYDNNEENERTEAMNDSCLPNYNQAIASATDIAIKHMVPPALLAVAAPVVVGLILGPIAVLGLLLGATYLAISEALFNGNAGGAFDNAKKAIELGKLEGHGKGTPAHIAAIIGDTIGDIMKDVVAVCCDICLKIMATEAVALAVIFYTYHLL